jgi:hypothetical protein
VSRSDAARQSRAVVQSALILRDRARVPCSGRWRQRSASGPSCSAPGAIDSATIAT